MTDALTSFALFLGTAFFKQKQQKLKLKTLTDFDEN